MYIGVSLRDWALKWVEGSIVSYFSDKSGKTSLNVVMGVIRRTIRSYGVKPGEIRDIIGLKILDPGLNIPSKVREEKARPLLEFIENLEKGEKSG
jgi:hypothetical protein